MKIYVGNFSYRLSEGDLREAFQSFGSVGEVTIVKDRETGRSRGFGFVVMADEKEARAAIAGLNGQMLDGRPINVEESRSPA